MLNETLKTYSDLIWEKKGVGAMIILEIVKSIDFYFYFLMVFFKILLIGFCLFFFLLVLTKSFPGFCSSNM